MSFGCALVAAIQTGCDLDEKAAAELAAKIIEGGAANGDAEERYYWPQRLACLLDPQVRDAAIRSEFNGRNLTEVCDRYGVSHMTVYRAINGVQPSAATNPIRRVKAAKN